MSETNRFIPQHRLEYVKPYLRALFLAHEEWIFDYCMLTGRESQDYVEVLDINHHVPPFLLERVDVADLLFKEWTWYGLDYGNIHPDSDVSHIEA